MIIGIIAEYNPFHNGHKYQIDYIKNNYNPELIVGLTTNYFSMRGDIQVLNKYDKTKIAINEGIDLVIEYPYLYSCQNADIFALNAIKILSLAKVDTIVAGSESNDLDLIKKVYEYEQENIFQNKIKEYLDKGNSYRKSFSASLKELYNLDLEANDLLNLKYFEAIKKLNLNIELKLIKRVGSKYLDNDIYSEFASATALRNNIKDISKYVPRSVNNLHKYNKFYDVNKFTELLKYQIINTNLSNIFEAKEGIEHLFNTNFNNITDLALELSSKRYKYSRIMRFISYIITNYTKDIKTPEIDYIRVLGFNQNGKNYLNKIKKDVNIVSRIKEDINPVLDFELKLAKLFSITFKDDFIKLEQSLPYKDERYLVGSDLDDTLLVNHQGFNRFTLDYIKDFTKNNYFVMVSGRPFSATYDFYKMLDIKQPFICDNGGSIYFPKENGEFDYILNSIPENIFKDFIIDTKDYLYAILDTVYKTVYTNDINRIPDFLRHFELPNVKLIEDDFVNLANHDAVLPNVWIYKDKIDDFNKVLDKYKDYIDYHFWGINDGYGDYEIFSKDCSKEKSLLKLAKIYNIDKKHIYAFGDQLNDLSMLQSKNMYGIAMIVAKDEIKQKSYDVTEYTSEEDGVTKYLEKHNII